MTAVAAAAVVLIVILVVVWWTVLIAIPGIVGVPGQPSESMARSANIRGF